MIVHLFLLVFSIIVCLFVCFQTQLFLTKLTLVNLGPAEYFSRFQEVSPPPSPQVLLRVALSAFQEQKEGKKIAFHLLVYRNTTSSSVTRHWKWMWHPGSKMSWLRQSHPARAASSASITCPSSPGSHVVWLLYQRRGPWLPDLKRESTTTSTSLHQNNSPVACIICFTCSVTRDHFVVFSIARKRWVLGLVFLECG